MEKYIFMFSLLIHLERACSKLPMFGKPYTCLNPDSLYLLSKTLGTKPQGSMVGVDSSTEELGRKGTVEF